MARRLALGALAALFALAARTANAAWQVHGRSPEALLDAAVAELQRHPDDPTVARRAVQLAGRRGRAALAERLRVRAAARGDYASRAAYAQALLAAEDFATAAAAFDDALRVAPRAPAALAGRARALAAAGNTEAAARAYDRALAEERRPPARRRLIDGALASLPSRPAGADLDRAIALRRELAQLAPSDDRAAEALADLLERAGRTDEAATALEARVPAGHPAAKLSLALRAARLRAPSADPRSSDRAAGTINALLRELPPTDTRRGEVWTAARDVARTRGRLSELADTLAHAPGAGQAHVELDLLGQVLEEMGDLDGALQATRRAHDLAPRDGAIGRRLVALLDRAGNAQEARTVEEELARRRPGDVDLATELADRQWRAGDRVAAGATLDHAMTRFAGEPAALERLAELAERWRDDRRAIRAWTLLDRREPDSEVAAIGLGEAQFQAGDRASARRTWAALRRRSASPAAGHLRFGEILLDHDMVNDARDEAEAAEAADPSRTEPHRLLARIAEREHQTDAATAEWEKVLSAGQTPQAGLVSGGAAARSEARARLLTLLSRQGRARLDAKIRELREQTRAHPDDLEGALFLADAEQRLGDVEGAIGTLHDIVDRAGPADGAQSTELVDAGFTLVRLLRRQGRLDEAQARLEALAHVAPGRAREAQLQNAELALTRFDRAGALAHARDAAAGADAATLARVGEIREAAGDDAGAAEAYRGAMSVDGPPAAPLALARLLARQGDTTGAAAALELLLRATRDDASLADAGRRAISLQETLGRLPDLAESLARPDADGAGSPARRHALLDVLTRMPSPRDAAEREAWARVGRLALRPLLEILSADEDVPDRQAILALGRLGNGDAAPALARIAGRALDKTARRTPERAAFGAREAEQAALFALAQLGDPRGFDLLARAAEDASPLVRRVGLWGLGRIADPRGDAHLSRALEAPQVELQALACLGLASRVNGANAMTGKTAAMLARVAQDPGRDRLVRRAAIAALGRSGAWGVDPLMAILDAEDAELARTAALALGATHDPRVPAALTRRALLPGQMGGQDPETAVLGLEAWLDPSERPAPGTTASALSVPDLIAAVEAMPPAADLTQAWRARVPEVVRSLGEALSAGGAPRVAALSALDSRFDEPGLGLLAPAGDLPLPPEAAAAAREVATSLADAVAAALDDPAPEARAAALSVLAKLGDARGSPARVAAAVAGGEAELAESAVTAARLIARVGPTAAAEVAAAVAPLARGDATSWRVRLTAVRVLAQLGPHGLPGLRAARDDANPLVRAAARTAVQRERPPGAA
ncbi:MAG TPA: HEAT repeat domain-containing protein [Polyangia bacterium]|nr:HEAT repeat domain-containing protein [Polyangia bacterium]